MISLPLYYQYIYFDIQYKLDSKKRSAHRDPTSTLVTNCLILRLYWVCTYVGSHCVCLYELPSICVIQYLKQNLATVLIHNGEIEGTRSR